MDGRLGSDEPLARRAEGSDEPLARREEGSDEPLARRAEGSDEPLARRAEGSDEPLARRAEGSGSLTHRSDDGDAIVDSGAAQSVETKRCRISHSSSAGTKMSRYRPKWSRPTSVTTVKYDVTFACCRVTSRKRMFVTLCRTRRVRTDTVARVS